jgi:hypothetical integral membrane protein (TIGR02206 family)
LVLIWWRIITWAVKHQDTPRLITFERALATGYLLLWIGFYIWWLLPANFNPATSFPLHICDIVALLVPLAILSKQRRLVALLYFWGIGFSLQGIITPDLQMGFLSLYFWLFWLHHAAIVGAAVYMVVVHRYRPTRKDLHWAVGVGLTYLALVVPINAAFGFDYGYLGRSLPSQPSLLDWLGPWPWRVGAMAVLSWLGMTLLLLPWEWIRPKET